MKTGTKSILFGVHCFFIHPIFVAIAWIKLYGFPFDLRIWLAFLVHDIGYIGKTNMDDEEGEKHVLLGAKIMGIFGKKWHDFSLYHSRFYCQKNNTRPSRLCYADKLAICLEPDWFYIFRASLSGEINEYMHLAKNSPKYKSMKMNTKSKKEWFKSMTSYLNNWINNNKN